MRKEGTELRREKNETKTKPLRIFASLRVFAK